MRSPVLTVDAVIIDEKGRILLVKRGNEPFKGEFALPGGLVEYGETVEEAVMREVWEETGLRVGVEDIVGVYSDPKRDPRGHFVSVVFMCEPVGGELRAGSDARSVKWFSKVPEGLAFDHRKILKDMGY